MPSDSFDLTMSSLSSAASAAAPLDAASSGPSATGAAASASGADADPLLAALSQTLTQLGYEMPAGSPEPREGVGADGHAAASDAADTTAAQFLAALYQALALQQSIAASTGVTPATDTGRGASNGAETASSGDMLAAYRDLGAHIADLSNAARVSGFAGSAASAWDPDFGDVSAPGEAPADASQDPLADALSSLNDALQTHAATLAANAEVAAPSLADVLDALSTRAGSLGWQPVGAIVDVAI